jgi:integrase
MREQILIGSGVLSQRHRSVLTYDAFMKNHYFPSKQSKRSIDKDIQLYRTRLSGEFGSQALGSISRQQIHAFQLTLSQSALAVSTQNAYLRLLRHSLNIALDLELIARNPAARVRLAPEDNVIENYLNDDQVKRLITVLDHHENPAVAGLIRILLSTGARRGEAFKAKWSDIKWDRGLWIIPVENSKSRKTGSIPLSDASLEVLKKMPRYEGTDYIFVNPQTRTRYFDIKKSWAEIKRRAELPTEVRLHDLRHTFASILINRGRSLYEVQRILRHSDPKVTTRYSHLDASTLRLAVNSV